MWPERDDKICIPPGISGVFYLKEIPAERTVAYRIHIGTLEDGNEGFVKRKRLDLGSEEYKNGILEA